ncbi:hypothetical protein V6N12_018289 [Hibiscus sabdariffa]|uniref:Uncharacterized protein n=1 Tax=Hibiscus sabdariffa TaxID=183260 RepID=A0ABR2BPY4_9ROSI
MPNDVIVTSVPLADSPQQAVSPDMPQQDVSPNMPQHHPLPQRICRPNPSFRWRMPRQFSHLCPLSTSYLRQNHARQLIYLGIVDYLSYVQALNNVDVVLHRLRPYLTKINRNRDDEDVPYPASFADTTHLLQFFKVLDADTPSSAELRVQRVECNFYYVSPEVYLNPSKPRTYPKRVYL